MRTTDSKSGPSWYHLGSINRLYAIDTSRSARVAPSNRDRHLKAHAPLLLCYSRAYHSIVDLYGLGILPVVSTGNALLISGFGSLVDL